MVVELSLNGHTHIATGRMMLSGTLCRAFIERALD